MNWQCYYGKDASGVVLYAMSYHKMLSHAELRLILLNNFKDEHDFPNITMLFQQFDFIDNLSYTANKLKVL